MDVGQQVGVDDTAKPGGLRDLAGLLRDWRNTIRVARHCRSLRNLFLQVQGSQPGLTGEALYIEIVRQHLSIDEEQARSLVGLAAQSYTAWPTPRPVAFRDVAHYLVVERLSDRKGWVDLTVNRAVNCRIPTDW